MSVPPTIEAALRRLAAALDHLDASAERRGRARATREDAAEEFAIMRDDRSRLALELDGALTRLRRLESASDDAIRRIDRATRVIAETIGEEVEEDATARTGAAEGSA